jgi:hypothetical protein
MAIVRCRECGKEVSTEAAICPHCGVREPGAAVAAGAARHAHGHERATREPLHDRHDIPVVQRRRGGRAGWMVALLLLLVLAALFGLWYGNVVDFN